jgi:hypothetical protein
MPNNLLRQPNFAALVALCGSWSRSACCCNSGRRAETLLDTDDAMQLVEKRTWLAPLPGGGPVAVYRVQALKRPSAHIKGRQVLAAQGVPPI